MKEETFHRLIKEIKPYLKLYLIENNIEINERNFLRCINPNHEDKNPSMHLIPASNDTVMHCFSCGANYDIFNAACIFQKLEDRGVGFIKNTIPALAKKYDIEFDEADLELSEEVLNKYRYRQIYHHAYETLKELATFEHCESRKWTASICRELGIGSVDFKKFMKRLCDKGNYSEDEIVERDIHNRLFGKNLITFTIFDHKNRVAGFVARNVLYDENNKATHPKYRNTSGDVPIYNKSEILYGLNKSVQNTSQRLDIFEGYSDWCTAQHFKHPCCAAMGGVALTLEHLKLVKDCGFTHINLIFDGDATGKTKTEVYLDKYAGKIEGLKITVMELPFPPGTPKQNTDPDDYFIAHGLEGFMKIEPMSGFDWKLRKQVEHIKAATLASQDIEPEELEKNLISFCKDELHNLAKSMIPLIMAETSSIEQGRMCSKLSRLTGVPETDIRQEVSIRSNRQVKDIGEYIQKKLKNVEDAVEITKILQEGTRRIEVLTSNKDMGLYHNREVLDSFNSFIELCDKPIDEIRGWKVGWEKFDDPVFLGGIPKGGSILTFAGSPNHGKSSLLMNIAKQLILPKQDNKGLSVLMWYLDDPRKVAWTKMLASMTCESTLNVMRPERSIYHNEERKKNYHGWRNYLRQCISDNKLLIKSQDIGNDISSLEYWIKYTQDLTGNDVLVFVDAVHDMVTGSSSDNDERIKFARIYDWVQKTTETLNYSFLTCAHITKMGMAKNKPEQSDLAETGKIIFASKVIGMVHSELDYMTSINKRDNATRYWEDEDEVDNIDKRKPILEVNITKNKEAQWKGAMYFKHKAEACFLSPIKTSEVEALVELNKAVRKEEIAEQSTEFNDMWNK